ncbi:hypothetical protein [Jeongeupia naejangsanensis]|uniref:Uncharacterized protein n=1 Tax=Jeongeupia naejangsanensis TaxID=613195 RepID=A0ABS2BJL0_9NEIS|nr:hypothetical protein [Jeongeupia naejangsanensis]MBM3115802.1 hypothetical protein [Jeongeupia naejangsanensis]
MQKTLIGLLRRLALAGVVVAAVTAAPAFAQPSSGTILSIDQMAGAGSNGKLFAVDRQTGTRTVLSDLGQSGLGVLGRDPNAISWLPQTLLAPGAILLSDGNGGSGQRGAVLKVNPNTGTRTLLSDFGNPASGPLGLFPSGVLAVGGLLDLWATIYVVDPFAGTDAAGGLFKVRSDNGQRTLLSDFGDPAQGPLGVYPDSIALRPALLDDLLGHELVVADASAGTGTRGAVFIVSAVTGTRTLLSDFGNASQGTVDANPLSGPVGVAVSPAWSAQSGAIYVVVAQAGTQKKGLLVRVNPISGQRTVVSDFGNTAYGPASNGLQPGSLSWGSPGNDRVLVQDGNAGTSNLGALYSVDPVSGLRTLLSDFGNTASGALGNLPAGLTIVP